MYGGSGTAPRGSAAGSDELGERILADLRREGVDVSAAVVDKAAATGLMFKERRLPGIVRVSYYRKGFAVGLSPPICPRACWPACASCT